MEDIKRNKRKKASLDYYYRNRDKILEDKRIKYKEKNQPKTNSFPSLSYESGERIAIQKKSESAKTGKTIYVQSNSKSNNIIKSIEDPDSYFFQLPKKNAKRDCIYICAPNQAGKSTYVAKFIKEFIKLKKDKPIILFSKLNEDPILDKYDIKKVDLDTYELENDTLEQLEGTLAIFDDVDQIHDKKLSTDIYNTANEILCNGAHFDIDLIITNHLLSDYRNTRIILNECSSITVFPKSGCNHQIGYVLKNYIGLDKKQIKKIKNLPSRWVTIFKNYPQIVLYEKGIYLL